MRASSSCLGEAQAETTHTRRVLKGTSSAKEVETSFTNSETKQDGRATEKVAGIIINKKRTEPFVPRVAIHTPQT